MKRFGWLFLWVCTLGAALAAEPAPGKLNVFIWSEYLDPAVVKAFETKEHCEVTIDLYEDAESMLAKIQGGGVSLYDIVVPPDHLVTAMTKLNLLAPLRREHLPNLKNLDPQFLRPPYDPENKFTVAYQWGTVGILARRQGTNLPPATWGLFFDDKQAAKSCVLIDSVRDMVGAALKYRGHSLNATDPAQLKEARALVLAAKARASGFDGSVGAKNRVLAKTAQAAIVYSGEGMRAMQEDTNVVYFIPKEGSQIWVDNLAIPAQAPHRELAEKFINYLLEPETGAKISAFTQFSTPNAASRKHLPAADLENPVLYPPAEVRAKLEFLQDLGAKNRLYDEIWTQIKTQ